MQRVLEQFIALRHEVNLQTKATRAQQEQTAETLRQLSQAVDALQRPAPNTDEQLRPVLKTLVDLHDALAVAQREFQRGQDSLWQTLEALTAAPVEEPMPPWFWARWFRGRSNETAPHADQPRAVSATLRKQTDALLTGYAMSLQRLDAALQLHGLEPIDCVGQLFDPELMEVVEVMAESARPSGEVLTEVRRGYRWRGRVFRYAQVAVAK